ncbi:PepSY domain-containing protein [Oceanobacillus saliphilus]
MYEVEIENGNKEAEIEIDAYTGEVLVIEIDKDD